MPEAQYLLNKLIEKGSYTAVMRHVMSVLATRDRKRDICLESLQIVFENETEQGLTDRAKSYMRSRLRIGMIEFENSVTRIIEDAACACSMYPVTQNKRGVYDFGPTKCSNVRDRCGVVEFLRARVELTDKVLQAIKQLPATDKTKELQKAEAFIESILQNPDSASLRDPCLEVGDLIIALESADIPVFYTLNFKESKPLCRVLGQRLIVGNKNPNRAEEVHEPS